VSRQTALETRTEKQRLCCRQGIGASDVSLENGLPK
jgi:hypothetical protein